MTKVEQRWRWIANRVWGNSPGWAARVNVTAKGDIAIFDRRLKAGHVERNDFGLYRLTEAGRRALEASPPTS